MPVVKSFNNKDPLDAMLAFSQRGRLGRGSGLGFYDFGKAVIGEFVALGGTYQRRVSGYNNKGRSAKRRPRTYYVRMRDCTPSNPRTPKQQAHRMRMRQAVSDWRNLTEAERQEWNRKAARVGRYGFNRFLSWRLKQLINGS